MRLPFIIASFLVGASLLYKYSTGKDVSAKSVFSWSFILLILGIIGQTSFFTLADIFSYIIITIIVLNDGYEMIGEF